MQLQPIHIRRGILQGDSLSPLIFCTALIPATHELFVDIKYMELKGKISHLLCTDDLKLLDRSEDNLEN